MKHFIDDAVMVQKLSYKSVLREVDLNAMT